MTNGAAHARLRLGTSQTSRDPRRARIEQHRKSLRVIIVLAPSDVLAPLRTRAAMTARRFASDRADKSAFTELLRLFRQEAARTRDEEKRDARSFQQHAKSLAPAFCKMPLQRCASGFAARRELHRACRNRCFSGTAFYGLNSPKPS